MACTCQYNVAEGWGGLNPDTASFGWCDRSKAIASRCGNCCTLPHPQPTPTAAPTVVAEQAVLGGGLQINGMNMSDWTESMATAFKTCLAHNATGLCGRGNHRRDCTADDVIILRVARRSLSIQYEIIVAHPMMGESVLRLDALSLSDAFIADLNTAGLQITSITVLQPLHQVSMTSTPAPSDGIVSASPAVDGDSYAWLIYAVTGLAAFLGLGLCVCLYCFSQSSRNSPTGSSSKLALSSNGIAISQAFTEAIPDDLPGSHVIFGSMRFPAPPEAFVLQEALRKHGVYLKIVDVNAGCDIDHEVFSWLDHAESMLIFGGARYGQDTGNPACTYNEYHFARESGKRIILVRMIPWDDSYQFELGQDIFKRESYAEEELPYYLEWQAGEAMPIQLAATVALRSQPVATQQLCRQTGLALEVVNQPYLKLKGLAKEKGVPASTLHDCLGKDELLLAMAPYCMKDDGMKGLAVDGMMPHSSSLLGTLGTGTVAGGLVRTKTMSRGDVRGVPLGGPVH